VVAASTSPLSVVAASTGVASAVVASTLVASFAPMSSGSASVPFASTASASSPSCGTASARAAPLSLGRAPESVVAAPSTRGGKIVPSQPETARNATIDIASGKWRAEARLHGSPFEDEGHE